MSEINCYAKVKAFAQQEGIELDERRLRLVSDQLDRIRSASLTKAEFQAAMAQLIDQQLSVAAQTKRTAKMLQLQKVIEIYSVVSREINGRDRIDNLRDFYEGGGLKLGDSVNLDPKVIARTYSAEFQTMLLRAVEPYKDILESGKLDREIYQELWAIEKGKPAGQSGSKEASSIASSIHALQNAIVEKKQAYNPFMEKAEEYLVRRTHDREKVAAVEENVWVADAMKTFGQRSFPDLGPQEKIEAFQALYGDIKEGSYGTPYQGSNVMYRMAKGRTLVANDWQSAFDYNTKYGKGTVFETLYSVINRAGKDLAVLNKFGATPLELRARLEDTALRGASAETKAKYDKMKPRLDAGFNTAMGLSDAPAKTQLARAAQNSMALTVAAKLGMAFISSWDDMAKATGLVQSTSGRSGVGGDLFKSYMKFFASDAERGKVAEYLWLGAHSTLGELMNDLGSAERSPGIAGKLANGVTKLSFLKRHVEAARTAVADVVSKYLADVSDTPHADLPAEWKNGLLRYGIREAEWDTLRHATVDWSEGASEVNAPFKIKTINPESIQNLPDEIVKRYIVATERGEGEISRKLINMAKSELGVKVGAMINQHADLGSSTAGSRQSAFMFRGRDINDPIGLALRLVYQFKSAALTTLDTYRRIYYSGKDPMKANLAGVAQTMAFSMLMYTFREMAKDVISGKTPEDPATPAFAAQAVVGSGIGGFAGDILLNEMKKDSNYATAESILRGVAGPLPALATDIAALGIHAGKSIAKGKPTGASLGSEATRIASGMIPAQNLFYTKALMNYYFLNGLHEFTNRGYLRNLEHNVQKTPGLLNNNQEYFMLKPTDSARWLE